MWKRIWWAAALAMVPAACGQSWDGGAYLAGAIAGDTNHTLRLTVEQRGRYESRTGTSFGESPDAATGLYRTRLGLTWTPLPWLKFSGMMQDARAPWYGPNAPNTIRDPADLEEGYIELFPSAQRGLGMNVGRMMVSYGDGRLIGIPDWSSLSRTYDEARVYWRARRLRVEFLAISPVKVLIGEFNRPNWGERIWGSYNSLPGFTAEQSVDVYLLRHDQNRPGGFTGGSSKDGTDRLGTTTLGTRWTGPLTRGVQYTVEAALQRGKAGPASLSAGAFVGTVSRRWTMWGKPLNVLGEYKYASGTDNPSDTLHSGTFDQISPANHDKFGHEDLFGWRNMHNARSVVTLGITRAFALNFMYDDIWLASSKDGIYNSAGKLIARSPTGAAGRHVGRETDVYGTWRFHHFTFGAGWGHLFTGGFLRATTPGVGPTYLYVFHTYSL
ncbi:MAG: alginate export family protein [Acidobacteria bacterium]|nr:alginate export family protein [Acidobacteriota bacterium]